MPRPKSDNERIHLNLNRDIIAQVNVLLADPKNGKLRYGALTNVGNKLFSQWLKGFHEASDRIAYLRAYGVDIEAPVNPNTEN